ncbi:porin [Pseudorhodoferax sp.]|uniref:porin n=1 Tax=Pseudorhodoferax sp. TaxID=1993553 RepID=UPI002DD6884B|nr:porin [Pseudorhodoferax sp.]
MKHRTAACAGIASLALLAGPAPAQPQPAPATGVSLYGVLDAGLLTISNTSAGRAGYVPAAGTGQRKTTYKDGGLGASNWGLRGQEDLGGGYGAFFQLQGNVNSASGATGGPNSASATATFNQFTVVGLSGPFGQVKLGRQVTPMYYAMASTDARGARYFGSALTALVGLNSASGVFIGNNSNAAFGAIYNDNAVVYTSPTWQHLTLNLSHAFGEGDGPSRANRQQSATLLYNDGRLRLSALLYQGHGNNLPAATTLYTAALGSAAAGHAAAAAAGFTPTAHTNRLVSLGALYTWDAYTASAALYRARNPARAVVPGGSASLNMWSVAAGWRITPLVNLTAGYYRMTDNSNAGHQAAQFAAGVDYVLSRRTTLYAQGAAVRNEGANMNLSPVYATPVAAGKNVQAWMLGLRHTF